MMALPQRELDKCRNDPSLRRACPTLVPNVDLAGGLGRRSFVSHARPKLPFANFDVEWGAPYRRRVNERDRPPRFMHLVVETGDLSQAFGFGWPGESRPPRGQPGPRDLGARRWSGRVGRLVLAPRYPFGGQHGAHLVFRYAERDREYAVSLHAWLPLQEAEAALEGTVASIP